jgi:hypothetical protein
MRQLRILAASAWYLVSTAVNNREPLFWSSQERARFEQVLCEARERYAFALRVAVMFYIKPDDGFQLQEIMRWIKQTYSVRYNVHDGRTGYIWGDRYASRIQAEGPPVVRKAGRRGRRRGASAVNPAASIKGSPCAGKTA